MSNTKLSYADASKYAKYIRKNIQSDGVRIKTVIVGGLRRKSEFVKDIDLLVLLDKDKHIGLISFKDNSNIQIISQSSDGPKKKSFKLIITNKNSPIIAIDLFTCLKSDKPFAMLHHTGSKTFNIKIRVHAKKMGLKLNQYGIFKSNKKISKKFKSERDILRYIGVKYLTPKERNL